jgi:hypothetical protein
MSQHQPAQIKPADQDADRQYCDEPRNPMPLGMNACIYPVSVHDSTPPRRCRGNVPFLQLLRALIATHLNGLAADLDLDGIQIQLAIASRTSRLNHDITLQYPKSGSGE